MHDLFSSFISGYIGAVQKLLKSVEIWPSYMDCHIFMAPSVQSLNPLALLDRTKPGRYSK